jgi:beta-galactosidase
VSALLKSGTNTLVVKVNNSTATTATDPTAIAPLSGDFNMSGGLYRGVSLVSAPNAAHIALNDLGSTGVYARTVAVGDVTNSGNSAFASATVDVNAKLSNGASTDGTYTVRASLVDSVGGIAGTSTGSVTIKARSDNVLGQQIKLGNAHLWNGVKDPYLYTLVVDLLDGSGNIVDKVVQKYGVRSMSFDANKGFSLNGKSLPLRGVNTHQDMLGKAWAISESDVDARLATIMDIGANTVRMAHYQHSDYTYAAADKLGLVVWAENGFVDRTLTSKDCGSTSTVPQSFSDNAKLQTQEMVRQAFNHASIGMWSIANEVSNYAMCKSVDTVTPLLRELQALTKAEDPSRVTTLADSTDGFMSLDGKTPMVNAASKVDTGGITDIWGGNRYFGWYFYYLDRVNGMGKHLDALRVKYPNQPLGVAEYGAGAALSHQTDNPMGGVVSSYDPTSLVTQYGVKFNSPLVLFQPEGYANFVHEQTYSQMAARPYIWGTYELPPKFRLPRVT